MKIITSWDDGSKLDLDLVKLLLKYNIPGIFFIPSNCELDDSEIRTISNHRDMEIGGHTTTHPDDIKRLEYEHQFMEISDNKIWLEEVTEKEINKFCYPSGKYSKETIKAVEESGFKYARTVDVMSTTEPNDPLRARTSIHVYPNRKEYNGRPWYEVAEELYKKTVRENGVFHLWGHSWEIEKFNLWDELENFLKKINKYE